jgi:antitoxin component YwqK of YwqJK toxin-antitoxin module
MDVTLIVVVCIVAIIAIGFVILKYIGKNALEESLEYYDSGELKHRFFFDKKTDNKNGKETFYYRDGKENKIRHWKDGKLHGKMTIFYPTGETYIESNYTNDNLDGTYRVLSKTKDVIKEYIYSDGVMSSEETIVIGISDSINKSPSELPINIPDGSIDVDSIKENYNTIIAKYSCTRTKDIKEIYKDIRDAIDAVTKYKVQHLQDTINAFVKYRLEALQRTVGRFSVFLNDISQKNKKTECEVSNNFGLNMKTIEQMCEFDISISDSDGDSIIPHLLSLGGGVVAAVATKDPSQLINAIGPSFSALKHYSHKRAKTIEHKKQVDNKIVNVEEGWERINDIEERFTDLSLIIYLLEHRIITLLEFMEPLTVDFDANNEYNIFVLQKTEFLIMTMNELVQTPRFDTNGDISSESAKTISKTNKIIKGVSITYPYLELDVIILSNEHIINLNNIYYENFLKMIEKYDAATDLHSIVATLQPSNLKQEYIQSVNKSFDYLLSSAGNALAHEHKTYINEKRNAFLTIDSENLFNLLIELDKQSALVLHTFPPQSDSMIGGILKGFVNGYLNPVGAIHDIVKSFINDKKAERILEDWDNIRNKVFEEKDRLWEVFCNMLDEITENTAILFDIDEEALEKQFTSKENPET